MISVCIATYNGEKYIGEQIASILKQLNANDEVIISDDGSTDATLSIIKTFQDPRIRVILGPQKHSPTLNFENVLHHAQGDYIFLSDQDDVWKTNKVAKNKIYNAFWKNGYTGCCMAFTRCVKDAALPFPKDIPMYDIWIGNVAAFTYSVKFIDDRLISFRRHPATNSCNGKGSKFSKWQQIRFRWNIIKNILKNKIGKNSFLWKRK
mgnify:CR=1 FL=1